MKHEIKGTNYLIEKSEEYKLYKKLKDGTVKPIKVRKDGKYKMTIDGKVKTSVAVKLYSNAIRELGTYDDRYNLSDLQPMNDELFSKLSRYETDTAGRVFHVDKPEIPIKIHGGKSPLWYNLIRVDGKKSLVILKLLKETGIYYDESEIKILNEDEECKVRYTIKESMDIIRESLPIGLIISEDRNVRDSRKEKYVYGFRIVIKNNLLSLRDKYDLYDKSGNQCKKLIVKGESYFEIKYGPKDKLKIGYISMIDISNKEPYIMKEIK